jgi:hypothetical protein
MQKVEGSSPFIRFEEARVAGFLWVGIGLRSATTPE